MLNINEEWKPVVGFEKLYEVSNLGNIRNTRGKVLKVHAQNSGYFQVTFYDKGKKKMLVHRVVSQAWISNIESKPYVNHLDGDKANNSVDNLEWCTNSENILHARSTGLNPYNNPTTGKKLGKGSKYHNVSFDRSRNKWTGGVRHEGKTKMLKRFATEIDAAIYVNTVLDLLGLDDRPRNIID